MKGRKLFCFIDMNRDIKRQNVTNKIKILKEDKEFIDPIKIVKPDKFDEYSYTDALTRKSINKNDLCKYMCVIDGQHRYMAHVESKIGIDNIKCEDYTDVVLGCSKKLPDYIAAINSGKPWDIKDHAKVNWQSSNAIGKFISEKMNDGYSKTALVWFVVGDVGIGHSEWYSMIQKNEYSRVKIENFDKITKALEDMDVRVRCKHEYIPKIMFSYKLDFMKNEKLSEEEALDKALSIFKKFTKEEIRDIDIFKGTNVEIRKRIKEAFDKHLND